MNLMFYVPIWWLKILGTITLFATFPFMVVGLGWCGVSREWMFISAAYAIIILAIWIK